VKWGCTQESVDPTNESRQFAEQKKVPGIGEGKKKIKNALNQKVTRKGASTFQKLLSEGEEKRKREKA